MMRTKHKGAFEMRVLLAVCFAIALDRVACAQEGRFHYKGQGAIKCETFVVFREISSELEDHLLKPPSTPRHHAMRAPGVTNPQLLAGLVRNRSSI